ncbi:hypothetical protein H9660_10275 [Clostridium sp. Sa3CUN1]|uniref:Phage protein n=1 Tax=Clostridium gallinarum TaxID=2762246 RepID=A0ABR8Q542_9CLOT|nr:hypothetical protein [Clostridium gallinarum]MBD7915533.1 hypothetical protein [Clostridium gallinarum]
MKDILLEDKKRKILENINYAKTINMDKVSAMIITEDEIVKKDIISWLINGGYKVSLIKDEVDILNIEW